MSLEMAFWVMAAFAVMIVVGIYIDGDKK